MQQDILRTQGNTGQRLLWPDFVKMFFAMQVVYCHCYCIFYPQPGFDYIDLFFPPFVVPTFFTISGFFAYKSMIVRPLSGWDFPRKIWNKFRVLFVPAVLFFILTVPDIQKIKWAFVGAVWGHYYLVALFDVFILNFTITILSGHASEKTRLILVSAGAVLTTILITLFHDVHGIMYMQWKDFLYGNMFFVMGIFISRYRDFLFNRLSLTRLIVISVAFYFLQFIIVVNFEARTMLEQIGTQAITRITLSITGIIMTLCFAYKMCLSIPTESKTASVIRYFGSRSLATYVISWVYISLVARLSSPDGIPYSYAGRIASFVIIYLLSLATYDLLCAIPGVKFLIFGKSRSA